MTYRDKILKKQGSDSSLDAGYAGPSHGNHLKALEIKLKSLWNRYISHLDKFGHNKQTNELRKQYFNLYGKYRDQRTWKKLIDKKANSHNEDLTRVYELNQIS